MIITFNSWLPDIAPEVIGVNGLVDLANLRRLPNGGYGIAYDHTANATLSALESRVCGSQIIRAGITFPHATFVGTEEGLWECNYIPNDWKGRGQAMGSTHAITGFTDQGGTPNIMRAACAAHGYVTGDFVTIVVGGGSGLYNGTYEVQSYDTDWFEIIHADAGADTATVGDGYALGDKKWDFCQFDAEVIAVCGGTSVAPQAYTYTGTTTSVAAFADLDADAPYAYHCATIGQHLVLGLVKARGAHAAGLPNTMPNAVWWSAIGDPTGWPSPGTSTAIAQQSDYRKLLGDGGNVNGIIGGEAVGYVLQEKTIWQMTYVGGSTMFQIDPIEPNHGLAAPGCAINTPVGLIFLDREGLYVLAPDGARPLGVKKWSEYMMSQISAHLDEWHKLTMVPDPRETKIYLLDAYASPAKVFVYDWAEDELTYHTDDLEWIGGGRVFGAGWERDQLVGYNTDHEFGVFSTLMNDGFLETGDIQPSPGRRSTLVKARPLMQNASAVATLEVSARDTLDEALSWGSAKSLNSWNEYDCSEDGRYFRFQINYTAGSESLSGLELEFVPSGMY